MLRRVLTVGLALVAFGSLAATASAQGGLDPSFGDGGLLKLPELGYDTTVEAMEVYPDGPDEGKILIAGSRNEKAFIARLSADGSLDESWGNSGLFGLEPRDPPAGLVTRFTKLAIGPDDEVYYVERDNAGTDRLGRLGQDGVPDESFGTGGSVSIGGFNVPCCGFAAADLEVYASGPQAGKPVFLANKWQYFSITVATVRRLELDGSPDLTFSDDGSADIRFDSESDDFPLLRDLALGVDGSAWVSGGGNFKPETEVQHLLADGSVDPAFTPGSDLGASFDLVPDSFEEGRFALQPGTSSDLVVTSGAGDAGDAGSRLGFLGVGRVTAAGELDPDYAAGSPFSIERSSSPEEAETEVSPQEAEVDEFGRTTVLSWDSPEPALVRLTDAGQPDADFGQQGVSTLRMPDAFSAEPAGLEVDGSTQLVAGSTVTRETQPSGNTIARVAFLARFSDDSDPDLEAPETMIDGPEDGSTTGRSPTFFISSPSDKVSFDCTIEAESQTYPLRRPCIGGDYTIPSEYTGSVTLTVRAVSVYGVPDPSPATRSFTVEPAPDTTAPETTIDAGPQEGETITTDSTTFSFSSDERKSTFECKFDGGPFEPCASPQALNGLDEGSYAFQVRAIDEAGNIDPTPAFRSFTVDTDSPPETTVDSGPAQDSTISTDSPSFEFSSSESGSSFQCAINYALFTPCASPFTTPALEDGQHTFQVRAIDEAGNIDETPASRSFTVDTPSPPDTTPPETTIDSGPAQGSTISTDSPDFEFSSSESGSSFQCAINYALFTPCASPFTTPALADGQHTFQVRAIDQAGNIDETPATRSFTVDTPSPPEPACEFPELETPPTLRQAAKDGITASLVCNRDSTAQLKLRVTRKVAKYFGLKSRTIAASSGALAANDRTELIADLRFGVARKLAEFRGETVYFKADVKAETKDGAELPKLERFGQFAVGGR